MSCTRFLCGHGLVFFASMCVCVRRRICGRERHATHQTILNRFTTLCASEFLRRTMQLVDDLLCFFVFSLLTALLSGWWDVAI